MLINVYFMKKISTCTISWGLLQLKLKPHAVAAFCTGFIRLCFDSSRSRTARSPTTSTSESSTWTTTSPTAFTRTSAGHCSKRTNFSSPSFSPLHCRLAQVCSWFRDLPQCECRMVKLCGGVFQLLVRYVLHFRKRVENCSHLRQRLVEQLYLYFESVPESIGT